MQSPSFPIKRKKEKTQIALITSYLLMKLRMQITASHDGAFEIPIIFSLPAGMS